MLALMKIVAALVTVILVKGVVPPTTPAKANVPVPVATVRGCAPSTVLLKAMVMFPVVDVIEQGPVKVTGVVKVKLLAPDILMLLATCVTAALVKTRLVKGVVAPIAPPKMILPAVPALNVKLFAPLIVFENEMLAPVAVPPALVVSNVIVAPTVTSPFNTIGCPRVVIPAFKAIVPAFALPAVIVKLMPAANVKALLTVIVLPAAF